MFSYNKIHPHRIEGCFSLSVNSSKCLNPENHSINFKTRKNIMISEETQFLIYELMD